MKNGKRHPQGGCSLTGFTKYKAEETMKTMIAEVCSVAGLGFSPCVYNQNGNEYMNSVLQKAAMCYTYLNDR